MNKIKYGITAGFQKKKTIRDNCCICSHLVATITWISIVFCFFLIELGLNDTSTLVGHFVSSTRENENRDRRDGRGDERERTGRRRNRNKVKKQKK